MFSLPEHLNYFSPDTMTKMLAKHGYELLELKTVSGEGYYSFYTLLSYAMSDPEEHIPANGGVNDAYVVDHVDGQGKRLAKKVIGELMRPPLHVINALNLGQGLEVHARKV